MGTRSLTHIREGNKLGKVLLTIYRQYDGYPDGHGLDLAEFLKDMNVVNGLTMDEKKKVANGMGCLAAQLVAHLKQGPGNIYIYPPKSTDCGEEYVYTIYYDGDLYKGGGQLKMVCQDVYDHRAKIFDGTPEEFITKFAEV